MTNENKHKQTTQMEYSYMAGSGTVYDKHLRHGVGPHHARSESGSPPSAVSRRNSKRHTPCQYHRPLLRRRIPERIRNLQRAG